MFINFAYPSPPNLKEKIIWQIPKFGTLRRYQYFLRYFTMLDLIENSTRSHDKPDLNSTLKSDLMRMLKAGQFDSIEIILLRKLEQELKISIKQKTSQLLCSKPLPVYIEELL